MKNLIKNTKKAYAKLNAKYILMLSSISALSFCSAFQVNADAASLKSVGNKLSTFATDIGNSLGLGCIMIALVTLGITHFIITNPQKKEQGKDIAIGIFIGAGLCFMPEVLAKIIQSVWQ